MRLCPGRYAAHDARHTAGCTFERGCPESLESIMVASQQRSPGQSYSNGPTELVAFAGCNLVVQTPLLLIWLWSQTLLQSAVASHLRICEAFSPHPMELGIFLMSTLLLSMVEFLLYCLILILGVAAFVGKISIFSVPRRLPQLATLLTALRTVGTISCPSVHAPQTLTSPLVHCRSSPPSPPSSY